MESAERQFIEAARLHGQYTLEGDADQVNGAYDKIVEAVRSLRATPDKGVGPLLLCLKSDDPSVVVWSALYLLPFREEDAVLALEGVAKSGIPRVSLGAEMTVAEWRSGKLKVE